MISFIYEILNKKKSLRKISFFVQFVIYVFLIMQEEFRYKKPVMQMWWKFLIQNVPLLEKVCRAVFNLEPFENLRWSFFCENSCRLLPVNYFRKKSSIVDFGVGSKHTSGLFSRQKKNSYKKDEFFTELLFLQNPS